MEGVKDKSEHAMDPQLSRFLSKFSVQDAKTYTHSSQIVPFGKFQLSGKDLDKFYDLYCSKLDELGDGFISGIAEKPQKYMPVLVDVDIKLPYDETWDEKQLSTHLYRPKHINKIIDIYNQSIKYLLASHTDPDQQLDPRHLTCFVLEKSQPFVDTEKETIKSGFHLHYPYLYFSRDDQEVHLEPRVQQIIGENGVFEDIGVLNSEEMVDTGMYNKPWLMYGSRKDPKKESYKLTRIVGSDMRNLTLDEVLEELPLLNNDFQELELDPDRPCDYYLPILLSVSSLTKKVYTVKLPPGQSCTLRNKLSNIEKIVTQTQNEKTNLPDILKQCTEFIPMLSPTRAGRYKDWINVGMCLWTLTKGCREGYDLWIAFSAKSQEGNFDETACAAFWKRYTPSFDWNMGHLRSWAKEDDPKRYEEYKEMVKKSRVGDSLNGGQTDLAKYLYITYGHEFVCADISRNIWYQYRRTRWVETQNGNNLYKLIDMDIVKRIVEEKIKIETALLAGSKKQYESAGSNMSVDTDDLYDKTATENAFNKSSEAQSMEFTKAKLEKMIAKLKDVSFKDKIIKECRSLFYQEDFFDKLDSNPYLVCFENGVLDLSINTFRPGRPDDYCSMSTKYDYKEFDGWDDPAVIEVMSFFAKVFVDPVIRNFFLEYLGTILKSGQDQLFSIWSGVGANAKSSVIELIHSTLGQYCTTLRNNFLVGSDSTASSSATPDLAKCRNRKLCYTSEPGQNTEFNCERVKSITGDKTLDCRELFKSNIDLTITFKLVLLCNNLPRIPPNDDGMIRRLLRVPFQSRFPKDDREVPEDYSEQVRLKTFKRDPHLQARLSEMKQPMMWIMFQYYKIVTARKEQQPFPDLITNAIEEYRMQNDEYLTYIKERLVRDPAGSITFDEFAQGFTTFCKEWYEKCKYKKPDIKTELFRRWGDPTAGYLRWAGYRLKQVSDEVQEEIARGTAIVDQTNAN